MAKTARKKSKASAKKKKKAPTAKKTAAPSGTEAATQLSKTVLEVEKILEKGARQLADARDRVDRAVATAGSKRTLAAHAAADRAREAAALVNERRLHVATRLTEARKAIRDEHDADLDMESLERALKETVERYEEALRANDRRVPRRPRDPRNR